MGISHSKQTVLVALFLAFRLHQSRNNNNNNNNSKGLLTFVASALEDHPLVSDVAGLWVLNEMFYLFRYALRMNFRTVYDWVGDAGYRLVKGTRGVDKMESDMAADIRKKLKHHHPQQQQQQQQQSDQFARIDRLPAKGFSPKDIIAKMKEYQALEVGRWKEGKVSGAVYHGGDEHMELLNQASNLYHVTNPLHPDLFPSVMKYEAEICSMTAAMMNGGDGGVCGAITSGGTESIIMATKAHRSWGAARGITRPEVVCCETAHAAIDKACDILGIRLIKVPMDGRTNQISLSHAKRQLTNDTLFIYSSAPSFPSGIIDPIAELSTIAQAHGCGLHVDCCLGGFYLPFLRQLGTVAVPDFDFKLKGVTTMSCDTHKYGYATKGTSVVLFRNKELRRHMYFAYPSWTGGLYVTPSTAGSRPGSLIAACWASMVKLGESGYIDATRKINDVVVKFVAAVRAGQIEGAHVVGNPIAMVVGLASNSYSIYNLSDKMAALGYSFSCCQRPALVHMCFTLRHTEEGHLDKLLSDLAKCAQECVRESASGAGKKKGGTAPMYGMASSLPAGPVSNMLNTYTDIVLEV